jgi:hypothetical protein
VEKKARKKQKDCQSSVIWRFRWRFRWKLCFTSCRFQDHSPGKMSMAVARAGLGESPVPVHRRKNHGAAGNIPRD